MKALTILISLFFVSIASFATTTTVKCWIPGEYEKETFVVLKMENGKFKMWDKEHPGRPDAISSFGLFSESVDAGAIETVKFGRYKNGYATVTIITTADALTVGISPDLETGFYKYEDFGSGTGSQNFTLKCELLK